MTKDVAFAAVELAMKNCRTSGLLFYGGEPLLEKKLIYKTVEYTESIKKKTGHNFIYKATTNGTLLDREFLDFAKRRNLTLGFSHDGLSQDKCRLFQNGGGTFDVLEDKISLLLEYQPYAIGMSVIDPSTVYNASETVKFLFNKGFKYITINVNYDDPEKWSRELLAVLEDEYRKIAELYLKWTMDEEKFYLGAIDLKILSLIKGEDYNTDRRRMAFNQPSVAPDGKIYSGSRHLGDKEFEIGDVFEGINTEKQKFLFDKGTIPPAACRECAIRTRCNYTYDTLTCRDLEIVPDISPIQCAHEQILTPIADSVAEKLYNERSALFMHKHYNELYPMISLVEDKGRST